MGWAAGGDLCCRPAVLLVGWPTGHFGCRVNPGVKNKTHTRLDSSQVRIRSTGIKLHPHSHASGQKPVWVTQNPNLNCHPYYGSWSQQQNLDPKVFIAEVVSWFISYSKEKVAQSLKGKDEELKQLKEDNNIVLVRPPLIIRKE
jgi:hypothetical protein